MDAQKIEAAVEALLFVSGDALPLSDLCDILEIDKEALEQALERMTQKRERERAGVRLLRIGDKVQLCTHQEYAPYIRKLTPSVPHDLSQTALETLSIIAYKQPVTKSEIEAVRGVRCDYSVSLLLERGLIVVAGKKDTIGRPLLYATNDEFLRHFGLSSLCDLPPLELEA